MSNSHLAGDLDFFWLVWHPKSAALMWKLLCLITKHLFACTCCPFNGSMKEIIHRNRQGVLPPSFVTVSAPSPQTLTPQHRNTQSLLLLQPSREQKAVWEPVGKLWRRISGERGSTLFYLNGDGWNIESSPDVLQNFWWIHFFPSQNEKKKLHKAIHNIANV